MRIAGNGSSIFVEEWRVIDPETANIIIVVNWASICLVLAMLGTVSNILCLIVFVKQGFSEPINVSLLGLTVSDLLCTFGLIWHSLCFNPLVVENTDLPFIPGEVQYLILGWPRLVFTRVTGWLTAFIALERCFCIVMPLKVKHFITPRRNAVTVVSIYLFVLITVAPVYYTSRLGWKMDLRLNKSRLGLYFTEDKDFVDGITFYINTLFPSVCCVVIVIICTAILVGSLRAKNKWRTNAAGTNSKQALPGESGANDPSTNVVNTQRDKTSSRDRRVAKMVTILSVIFVVSYSPEAILCVSMIVVPEMNVLGNLNNLLQAGWSFSNVLVGINSGVNILVYLNMSSKFRDTFLEFF